MNPWLVYMHMQWILQLTYTVVVHHPGMAGTVHEFGPMAMSRLCPRLLDLVAMSRNTAWFYQQVFGTIHKLSALASIIVILLSRYLVGVVARIWVHSIAQIVECGQWGWSNFCTYYFLGFSSHEICHYRIAKTKSHNKIFPLLSSCNQHLHGCVILITSSCFLKARNLKSSCMAFTGPMTSSHTVQHNSAVWAWRYRVCWFWQYIPIIDGGLATTNALMYSLGKSPVSHCIDHTHRHITDTGAKLHL